MLDGEGVEGQQLWLSVLQQPGDLGRVGAQLLDHLAEPGSGLRMRSGGEDPTDRAGDQRLLRSGDVAEHVSEGVTFIEFSPTDEITPVLTHLAAQMAG